MVNSRLLLVAGAVLAASNAYAALDLPVTLRAGASTAWAENISHTSAAADRKSAARFQASAGVSLLHEWEGTWVTVGEFAAAAESIRGYSKAGAVTFGPELSVRRKIGLGALAPVITAAVGIEYRDARVFADDGWTPSASLRVAKRINVAWRFSLTTDWRQHDSKHATFDTSEHRVFGQVTWDPSDRVQLSYGLGRLWGSVTANASWPVWARALSGDLGAAVFAYYNTVPWLTTDIYGPRWVTYRVDAFANFQWFEVSPALGRNTSLPLRFERMNTINRIGVRYPQEIWSLGLLHRF